MKVIQGAGKSVLLGGLASGIVSLIPVVNLPNLMLMMWMGVGGFLCVRRLAKENPTLSKGDAALTGGLSGMIGGAIFSSVTFATITGISPERLENLLSMLSVLFSDGVDEIAGFIRGRQFKVTLLVVLSVALLVSIGAGAVGGLLGRRVPARQEDDSKDGVDE